MKKNLHRLVFLFLFTALLSFNFLVAQPLSGNYTINKLQPTSGTNFQSFNDFATSINTNGVSANVIASVQPGTGPYQESVVFANIAGAGPSARIILEGNGEIITAVTSTTSRHVVRLTDIQFFTINNLHVNYNALSTGGFYGIHIYNSGSDIDILNCVIDIGGTTSTLFGSIVLSGSEVSILDSGDFHRVNIFGNTCTGGGYGVSVYGMVSNRASDINIENNFIYDFHSNGIYLRETDGAVVRNNHFDKRTSNVTSTNAIQIAQNANINASIYNNFISVSQTSNGTQSIRGIYLFGGTGHKVFNNVIQDVRLTTGNFTAIEVRATSSAPKIYFNTISLDHANATSGDLFGFSEELSNTGSELRNNMISISQTSSGTKAGISLSATSTVTSAINSNYNDLFIPGGVIALRSSTTPTLYTTLNDWITASTQDANSFDLDPLFVSDTLCVPTNLALDNTGITLSSYTTDITGALRSNTPDIGAYEFLGVGISNLISSHVPEIFPNPVKNIICIRLKETINSLTSVLVMNTEGKIVYDNIPVLGINENEVRFDFSSYSPGVYFIQMNVNGSNYVGRFVKIMD